MRSKYWAFLILLAVVLVLILLPFYFQDSSLGMASYGLAVLLSLYLFYLTADILADAVKKRRAFRPVLVLGAVTFILSLAFASIGNILTLLWLLAFIFLLLAACLAYVKEKKEESF